MPQREEQSLLSLKTAQKQSLFQNQPFFGVKDKKMWAILAETSKQYKTKNLHFIRRKICQSQPYGSEVNSLITSQWLHSMSLSQHKPNEAMTNLHISEKSI